MCLYKDFKEVVPCIVYFDLILSYGFSFPFARRWQTFDMPMLVVVRMENHSAWCVAELWTGTRISAETCKCYVTAHNQITYAIFLVLHKAEHKEWRADMSRVVDSRLRGNDGWSVGHDG